MDGRICDCDCDIVVVNFLCIEMTDEGARKYCTPIQGSSNGFTCHFCDWQMKGGGITRMKYHLSGNDPNKNARICTKVPPEVKKEMQELLLQTSMKKQKKKSSDINVGRRLTQNLEDSEEDAEAERELFRQFKKSRQEEASERFASGFEGPGGGSGAVPPSAPSLYRSESAKQQRIPEMMNPRKKKLVGRLISKFFIHANIAFNKVKSHHFKNMIAGVAEAGKTTILINA